MTVSEFTGAPKRRWSDEEIGFIEDHSTWSAREIGDTLGRGMQSVQKMREKLRTGWSPIKEMWTEAEIDFVRATTSLTAEQVAAHLGRTTSAIINRRFLLGSTEGISFDGPKSPYFVGGRRLLAKTCPQCGLLLTTEWWIFYRGTNSKGQGGWASKCTRCNSINARPWNRANMTPEKAKQRTLAARRSEAKFQAFTKDRAHRNREPWTEDDHKVLSNSDLTAFEKAISLGRTYSAVRTMCYKGGYKSRVGLGDPSNGEWIIYNPNEPLFPEQQDGAQAA